MRALTSSFGSENEVAVKILNGMWYCVIVHYRHGAKYFSMYLSISTSNLCQVQAYNLSTSNGSRFLTGGVLNRHEGCGRF